MLPVVLPQMAAAVAMRSGSSDGGGGYDRGGMDTGKYVRYTPEQVEALERVYAECPKPSSLRRQQLIRECPILSNIEPKQIKVWFQNRRCVAGAPRASLDPPSVLLPACVYFFSFSGIVRPCRFNSPPSFVLLAVLVWIKF